MNAVTSVNASKNLDKIIKQVSIDIEPTVLCNDNGEQAVLISLDEFNSWQETIYLLSNPANAEHLQQSIKEANAGEVFEKKIDEL
jgi:antitoxin YefM